MNSNTLLIVISGPSGVGKDTVINEIKKLNNSVHHTVTTTTRPKRHGEADGIDYRFATEVEFKRMIDHGDFLEWAEVYGNLYGTPKDQIRHALAQGHDVIAKVDVQGALNIKKLIPDALFIWISAPSIEHLDARLRSRNTDSKQNIELRIETAHREVKLVHHFDYEVINEDGHSDKTASEILDIVKAEKNRSKPRQIAL
ncbi:guanylate kinase [Chloroflexota bacterium]